MNNVQLGLELPIMEQFYTLQGEGEFSGQAAYFIRLAGCDVGCHWCDVKESWNVEEHPVKSIEQIVQDVAQFPASIVVITGGEPLMYDLEPITKLLHSKGKRTHIETSGAHKPTGTWDWFCLSPKKFKMPVEESYALADELKIIVFNKSDFSFAEEMAIKVSPKTKLLLQPEWGKQDEVLPMMISFVKEYPKWKISLQTHKFLNIP